MLSLHIPADPILADTPFAFDKLGRKELASVLTRYIDRLNFGATIAIDAGWGRGKTWFAKNWINDLKANGYSALYIDSFENDYVEDPFSLISSEIIELMDTDDKKKAFLKKAADVALAIAPTSLKALANFGGKQILGLADLTGKVELIAEKISERSSDALEKILEEKIKKHKENKKAIGEFRKLFSDFSIAKEKPLIVVIDELDRCKPKFSVDLLERIKHFFDVNNVVFVLFLNKEQMHSAIKGVYGQATDAHTYLEKFLNFTFTLDPPENRSLREFIEAEFKKYKVPEEVQTREFIDGICELAAPFNLTLRQIQRIVPFLSLAHPISSAGILLAMLAVLKVSRPDLFNGIIENDHDSLLEIKEILNSHKKELERKRVSLGEIEFLTALHNAWPTPEDSDERSLLSREYSFKVEKAERDYKNVAKLLNIMVR